MPTVEPVRITFDHAVDQASVASRLHLVPSATGSLKWLSDRELEYDHLPLAPSTTYQVVIEAGYRDAAGNVYVLRHHWSFITEPPPAFTAASPADGATGIDPADYLTVDFSRPMDAGSMRSGIVLSPQVAFNVRLDPTDARRAIVAPNSLLAPSTTYTMLITTGVLDQDGNQLDRVQTIQFTTGALSTLHGWIAFAALRSTGDSAGLWIVNDLGFPRLLLDAGSIQSFAWSPDGNSLVYESQAGTWSAYTPGGAPETLDFTASWAAALAPGLGYAYLDASETLRREAADKTVEVIASGVTDAAVSPDGKRIAYIEPQSDGTTMIWGYELGLRSHYVLGVDKGEVSGLSWSPAGNRLAYLRVDPTSSALRVLGLAGSASFTTIATGDLGQPAWLRDSDHLVIDAAVRSAAGVQVRKAFLINVAAPPPALTISLGLPADSDIQVSGPVPSPDGHQIAFISGGQVWLMNADGTRPVPLTRFDQQSFPYSCLMPAWTRS